jgi:hypothetical protein
VVGAGAPRVSAIGLPLAPRAGALTAFFSISFSMLSK